MLFDNVAGEQPEEGTNNVTCDLCGRLTHRADHCEVCEWAISLGVENCRRQRILWERRENAALYRNAPATNKVLGVKGLVDCTPPNGYSLEIVLSPLATPEELERALAYSEQTYGTRRLAASARDRAIEEEGWPPASVRLIPCE